jgi:hypothetical protein
MEEHRPTKKKWTAVEDFLGRWIDSSHSLVLLRTHKPYFFVQNKEVRLMLRISFFHYPRS